MSISATAYKANWPLKFNITPHKFSNSNSILNPKKTSNSNSILKPKTNSKYKYKTKTKQ